MIIAIHQPDFLPWLGFFYKVRESDIFVLLDNAQYKKNAVHNRSKIKTSNGTMWLTLPILTKGCFGQSIKDAKINNTVDWKRKHLETLRANYSRAPFFKRFFPKLEAIYLKHTWMSMCDLNIQLIRWAMCETEIEKETILASELGSMGTGTERIIRIVKKLDGNEYLSGLGGKKYQNEELFITAGIKLRYSSFEHPIYPQLWGKFAPNCSVIDLLFNCGMLRGIDV